MISPELLLRYPFFSGLSDGQLKAVAMLSHEEYCTAGDTLFETGATASKLYFLLQGSIELHYFVTSPHTPNVRKDFYVGHVNPGEPFGISGLIEPYRYTATAVAVSSGRILNLEAVALRALCQADAALAAALMHQVARAALSRLNETRIQLASMQP